MPFSSSTRSAAPSAVLTAPSVSSAACVCAVVSAAGDFLHADRAAEAAIKNTEAASTALYPVFF